MGRFGERGERREERREKKRGEREKRTGWTLGVLRVWVVSEIGPGDVAIAPRGVPRFTPSF